MTIEYFWLVAPEYCCFVISFQYWKVVTTQTSWNMTVKFIRSMLYMLWCSSSFMQSTLWTYKKNYLFSIIRRYILQNMKPPDFTQKMDQLLFAEKMVSFVTGHYSPHRYSWIWLWRGISVLLLLLAAIYQVYAKILRLQHKELLSMILCLKSWLVSC